MTVRANFSPEEWASITEAPLLAGARVAAAESGGAIAERFSIGRVYAAARELRGESALLDELVASKPSIDLEKLRGAVAASNERLRAALTALDQKAAPDDVAAYKGFVLAVVETVAEANREGGFAGIGGEEVSAREQAALDEMSALLET
jgi:hypothetical protein